MEMTWVRIPLKGEENDQSRDEVEKGQMAKSTRSENKSEKITPKRERRSWNNNNTNDNKDVNNDDDNDNNAGLQQQ